MGNYDDIFNQLEHNTSPVSVMEKPKESSTGTSKYSDILAEFEQAKAKNPEFMNQFLPPSKRGANFVRPEENQPNANWEGIKAGASDIDYALYKPAFEGRSIRNIPETIGKDVGNILEFGNRAVEALKTQPGELLPVSGVSKFAGDIGRSIYETGKNVVEEFKQHPMEQAASNVLESGISSMVENPVSTYLMGKQFAPNLTKMAGEVALSPLKILKSEPVKWVANNLAKYSTSQATGLAPETISRILEKPEDFAPGVQQTFSREGVAKEALTNIEKRIDDLSETGKEYKPIKEAGTPVQLPTESINGVFQKYKINVGEDGKLIFDKESIPTSPADESALQKWYDVYGKDPNHTSNSFLNARKALDNIIKWEYGKTDAVKVLEKDLRKTLNDTGREQIPGLKKLDDKFSGEVNDLKKVKTDYFNADGTIKDNSINKIANLTNKGRGNILFRLENVSPGITEKIKTLKAIEDINLASGHKVGTYVRGALTGGALYLHNPGMLVAAVLASPKVATQILRGYGKLLKIPENVMDGIITKYKTFAPKNLNIKKPPTEEPPLTGGTPPNEGGTPPLGNGRLTHEQMAEELKNAPMPNPNKPPEPGEVNTKDVIEMPVNEIKFSKDVPNFKEGASEKTGTIQSEELKGKYNRIGTAPIVVWERLNGDKEIITGRHRLKLARDTGEKTIPTHVMKESQGFTKKNALTFDAESNIMDEKGSIKDYAQYFKHAETSLDEAKARGLLSRAKGNAGFSIGRSASPSVYESFLNGKITADKAANIAEVAPNNVPVQQAALKFALGKQNPSADVVKSFAQILKEKISSEKLSESEQGDLFGHNDDFIKESEQLATAQVQKIKSIKHEIESIEGALKYPSEAKKLGVDISDEEATKQNLSKLKQDLNKWQNWTTNPELIKELKNISMSSKSDRINAIFKDNPTPKEASKFFDWWDSSSVAKKQDIVKRSGRTKEEIYQKIEELRKLKKGYTPETKLPDKGFTIK